MKTFAASVRVMPAMALALALTVGATAHAAAPGGPDRRGEGDLRGGPSEDWRGSEDERFRDDRDRDADARFRPGPAVRPDAIGRTAAFFVTPRLFGERVFIETRYGNQRRAAEFAADNFCRPCRLPRRCSLRA